MITPAMPVNDDAQRATPRIGTRSYVKLSLHTAPDVAQHLKVQHRFLLYQELIRTPYLQHST